jgi:hypothetical protein
VTRKIRAKRFYYGHDQEGGMLTLHQQVAPEVHAGVLMFQLRNAGQAATLDCECVFLLDTPS